MPRWMAWVVCGLGALLIVGGLHLWRLGRDSRGYTRTRGRIVRSEVEELPRPSEEGGPKFRPAVRYAFEARGHAYESERISVGGDVPESPDASDARALVGRYPAGSEVDVWFDPRDPRRSVLVRGTPVAAIAAAVVAGIALLGLGMFALAR